MRDNQLRYHDDYKFLPENYKEDFFWLRSSDEPRTIQSAEGILSELFPKNSRNGVLEAIPIHVIDETLEDMFNNGYLCPEVNTVYPQLARL